MHVHHIYTWMATQITRPATQSTRTNTAPVASAHPLLWLVSMHRYIYIYAYFYKYVHTHMYSVGPSSSWARAVPSSCPSIPVSPVPLVPHSQLLRGGLTPRDPQVPQPLGKLPGSPQSPQQPSPLPQAPTPAGPAAPSLPLTHSPARLRPRQGLPRGHRSQPLAPRPPQTLCTG